MTGGKTHRDLVVGDVMSPCPVTAAPDDTLEKVESEMDFSDIRHLPIVAGGKIVGILSDRDLRWADRASVVADLMSENVMSVTAQTRLCEASAVMLEHKIGALPVVDGLGALVGIVTETDFLRIAHDVCGGSSLSIDDS